MKNSSYYISPVGDLTHDLQHTVASNMVSLAFVQWIYTLVESKTKVLR